MIHRHHRTFTLQICLQNNSSTYFVHQCLILPVLFLQAGLQHGTVCKNRSETFVHIFDRKVRITLFQRTNKRLYILHILRNLIIHLLGQSNNNPLHRFFSYIFTDKVQKFMRGHRRQSVCDQLHCIAHSYSGTLSSIIYCYYSAHGVQKYKKDASRERKRLFYSIISNVYYSSTIATRLNLASS